jgi:hypothetical protein
MGQLTISRFRGDTAFGFVARIISTFFGGLVGLVMWSVIPLFDLRATAEITQVHISRRWTWEPLRPGRRLCGLFPILLLRTVVLARTADDKLDIFRDSRFSEYSCLSLLLHRSEHHSSRIAWYRWSDIHIKIHTF